MSQPPEVIKSIHDKIIGEIDSRLLRSIGRAVLSQEVMSLFEKEYEEVSSWALEEMRKND